MTTLMNVGELEPTVQRVRDQMSCPCGKRAFDSRQHAVDAHRRVSWRFRVYRCDRSDYWHVTNAEKR